MTEKLSNTSNSSTQYVFFLRYARCIEVILWAVFPTVLDSYRKLEYHIKLADTEIIQYFSRM